MRLRIFTVAALFVLAMGLSTANAAILHWDIDGAAPGASGTANATGAWNNVAANWNTDSTGGGGGALQAWTTFSPTAAVDSAVFSAGTDATGTGTTVTATGTPTVTGIIIEEGRITLAGRVDVNAGTVELKSGTGLVQASSGGATGTGITHTAGGGYSITGNALLRQTNASSAGSFVGSLATIATSNSAILTIDYTTANSLSIIQAATIISGNGSLVKNGVGVIAIASPSTYSGSTTINAGELRIRTSANRLPIGTAVTVNSGGILNLNGVSQEIGSLTGTGNVGTGAGILTIGGSASTSFDGALLNIANAGAAAVATGNGRLVKNGAGTITFNGLNDINGSVTLNAGGIIVSATGSLSGDIADLTVTGGTLTLNNATEKVENLSGTGGIINLGSGHVLTTDPVASTTYSGTIAGPGGLVKANALSAATRRTLTLSGNNTYDGNTVVTGGLISVQHDNALGSALGYTEVNATTVLGAEVLFTTAAGSVTTNEPFRISGAGSSNSGAIAVTSNATPTLSGPVTLIGNSTVAVSSNSAITFNNAAAFTSLANQNLTLQGGSGVGAGGLISGVIDLGAGSLTKLQGGKWELTAANLYTGGTTIGAGTLMVNNIGGSATGAGLVNVSGGTLAGTGFVTGEVELNGGTLSPGDANMATLDTGAIDANPGSAMTFEINTDTLNADVVNAFGALDIDTTGLGVTLNLDDLGSGLAPYLVGKKFTLLSYSGLWDGGTFVSRPNESRFTLENNDFIIKYDDTPIGSVNGGYSFANAVTLTVIPEPASFVLLGMGLVGVIFASRRRKG